MQFPDSILRLESFAIVISSEPLTRTSSFSGLISNYLSFLSIVEIAVQPRGISPDTQKDVPKPLDIEHLCW